MDTKISCNANHVVQFVLYDSIKLRVTFVLSRATIPDSLKDKRVWRGAFTSLAKLQFSSFLLRRPGK